MAEDLVPKTCVRCGKDVRGLRRTKDRKGRYWCGDCYREAVARQRAERAAAAAPSAPPLPALDVDAGMIALASDESNAAHTPHPSDGCPKCHAEMPEAAVLCMHCGYDRRSGALLETVRRRSSAAENAKDLAVAGATEGSILLLAVVGASAGGAIGAAIWAAVALGLNLEISWIAILVGVLAGAGARLVARQRAGMITGAVAALIALAAVVGGRFLTISLVLDDLVERPVDDSLAIEFMAGAIQEEAGTNTFGMLLRRRGFLYSGPELSWEEAMDRARTAWTQLDASERAEALAAIRADMAALRDDPSLAKQEGIVASLGLIDIFFAMAALGSAYTIGSGGSLNRDEEGS